MPNEDDFGHSEYSPPFDATADLDAVARDWLQHLVVLALRREVASRSTTQVAIAERLRKNEAHFRKILAGKSPMTLEQLVTLLLAFGPEILPSLESRDALFPPLYRSRLTWKRAKNMAWPETT